MTGVFSEVFNSEIASTSFEPFVQDNHSYSPARDRSRTALPGPTLCQVKLVRGAIFEEVVDIRQGSPNFRHIAVELSANNSMQRVVPIGFTHGF